MNTPDPVAILLYKLNANSETISAAYHQGRVYKTDENARDIERLRQIRLLSPDIRDAFQLRASFRQFLNAALNTERLFSMGSDIGGHFQRLVKLVDEHSMAYQEGRDSACEQYEVEAREAISDIADAIDDELIMLQAQVSTRFAAVATLAEKKRQNLHYQQRTEMLVGLLESFHFSGLGEQLQGHEELNLSFRALLEDRVPAFREALLSILALLNQYLFEFRQIEERAKKVRAFALYVNRNPAWEPKQWDEVAEPEEWLRCAAPLEIQASPDITDPACETSLAEIARTIPATTIIKGRTQKPTGNIHADAGNTVIEPPIPTIRKAVRLFFKAAKVSTDGISARDWWAANPSILGETRADIWLLRVLAEHDNKGDAGGWSLRIDRDRKPIFDGNVLIHDVIVSRKMA